MAAVFVGHLGRGQGGLLSQTRPTERRPSAEITRTTSHPKLVTPITQLDLLHYSSQIMPSLSLEMLLCSSVQMRKRDLER